MNFDTVSNTPCIPGTGGTGANGSGGGGGGGGGGGPIDPRCTDAAFAAANPQICAGTAYIVLKPSSSIILTLGSVQFHTFLYQNGVETELTSGLLFGSSDVTVFVVGASSGNGTGLKVGEVVVTVTYQGLSATAQVIVVDSTIGCSQTPVATAILVDNSLSMSQSFGGSYRRLLDFAKGAATAYAGTILQVSGQPKDSVSIFSFNDAPFQVSTGFISDTALLTSQIAGIAQSQGNTDLSSAIKAAATALLATNAAELVMLICSDGQQTDSPTAQDVLAAASAFTSAGGIIICMGCRASGAGFDLLERVATGGFFINATMSSAVDALGGLSYLKSAVCAGACVPPGDFYEATGAFDYTGFKNWSVIAGQANLLGNGFLDLLPGNGLYVELANDNHPATLQSIDKFTLNPGDTYEVGFLLAGNNETFTPSANQTLLVYVQDVNSLAILFQQSISIPWNSNFQRYALSFVPQYAATVRLYFQQVITAGFTGNFAGNLLDQITFKDVTTQVTLLTDDFDDENVTYTPPACGPSAALPALVDPTGLVIAFINYAGGSQLTGETYKYAFSYKTQQGETNLSPVVSTATLTPVAFPNQATLLSGIFPQPLTYPIDRILSIRIWRNDASGSSVLHLLAEINPENINYIDLEDHAQFLARVDNSIIPPVSNTTAVAQGALGFGLAGCYEPVCEPAIAIGAQQADPNPLPNIETGGSSGGGGGGSFTSTQQACGKCPSGIDVNTIDYTSVTFIPAVGTPTTYPLSVIFSYAVGNGLPNAAVIGVLNDGVTLPSANTVYAIDWSDDGISWTSMQSGTLLPSQFSVVTVGGSSSPLAAFALVPLTAPVLHAKYRLTVTSGDPLTEEIGLGVYNVQPASNPTVCKSANASSNVSQRAADSAALAAAQQALVAYFAVNCLGTFSSTKSFTASCPCGTLGSPVTKTVTYTSFISQADADTQALTQATAQANAALDCTLSNNAQQISVADNATANTPAAPYPSVEYVGTSGAISKVVVNVTNLSSQDSGGLGLLLVSPTGKTCLLMAIGVGGAGQIIHNISFTVDDTGVAMPSTGALINATTYKPTSYGIVNDFPGCPPVHPWGTTLSVFNGDDKKGSWALFVRANGALFFPSTIAGWSLTIT